MKLEEKLVQLRKEKGLSQMYLAEAMEVSRQAISRWEVGAAMPSTDNLRKLAELYGVSIEVLLNDQMALVQVPQKSEPQLLTEKEESQKTEIVSVVQSGYRPIYITVTAALVLLGIIVGYLIGQHRAQEVANTVIPIDKLEVEQWDDSGADMYTYGWPDVWEVLALVLAVLMLMGLACPAWANEETDKHYVDQTAEIERILAELGELRAEAILHENERTRGGASVECRVDELESELIGLGVEVLAQDEVAELMGQSGNARVTVPDTTNSVKWYSANVRQLYNGELNRCLVSAGYEQHGLSWIHFKLRRDYYAGRIPGPAKAASDQ